MIYPQPRVLPGGDRYVLVEFGDEMQLELNFLAHGLATEIAETALRGVVETAPCFASILIHYDPDEIGFDDLAKELLRLFGSLGSSEAIELQSRLFSIPTMYLDPWTRECVEDYCAKIKEKERDPEFVARINGLADARDLVRVHSATEYWVASLGFSVRDNGSNASDYGVILTFTLKDLPNVQLPLSFDPESVSEPVGVMPSLAPLEKRWSTL
jgi:urea carboxylase